MLKESIKTKIYLAYGKTKFLVVPATKNLIWRCYPYLNCLLSTKNLPHEKAFYSFIFYVFCCTAGSR